MIVPAHRFGAADFVGVYVALLLLIPSRLVVGPLGGVGQPATLWGLLGALWWVCSSIGGLRSRAPRNPVLVMLGVLAASITLAYVAGMSTGWYAPADIRGATDDVYDLVPSSVGEIHAVMISAANRGLIAATAWIGIALILVTGLRSARDVERVVRWIVAAGAVLATVGVIQFFTGLRIDGWFKLPGLTTWSEFGAVDTRSVVRRVYAMANHPIEFGVVLGAIFPLALHRALFDRSRRSTYSAIVIGFAAALSISRSAILVAAAALLVLFVGWPPRWRLRFLAAAPFALIGVRLVAPGVVGTLRSLFSNADTDPSVAGRTDDYAVALRVFAENPVFGRGLFTFVPRYYRILDNQLLMIALELGVVGLVAFVGLVTASVLGALGARRRFRKDADRHVALALAAAVAGISVSYVTFDTWGFPMAAGLSFVLFGTAGAALRVSTDGNDSPLRTGGRASRHADERQVAAG
jgi:hypothetical protein